MTQDETSVLWGVAGGNEIKGMPYSIVEAFAKLVAAKEREACVELIKSHGPTLANGFMLTEAIRARGEE